MQDQLTKIDDARRTAESLVFEGISRGMPMLVSRYAVRAMMESRGLPVPGDVLAFASEGQVSDVQVVDWDDPEGGLAIFVYDKRKRA